MAITLIDTVIHYRKKLDKNPDEDVILNAIHKLSKIPITIEILQATHIGKCIRKLSKRDDIAGKKARTLLNKWRDIFANQSDGNLKSNVSKKENVNNESSSKHDVPQDKHVKGSSREHKYNKHQKNSLSNNSSQHSDVSSRSLCIQYDPHTEVSSEGYNPEFPEFFPNDRNSAKMKKPVSVDTYEPSSLKRKLKAEEESVNKSVCKKIKAENLHNSPNSDYHCAEYKKSLEKRDKHSFRKEKRFKDDIFSNSHTPSLREPCDKVKSEKDSNVKRPKSKELKDNKTSKSKTSSKPKVKIHSSEEFTSSNVTFEDCLGFNDIVPLKKKKSIKSHTQPTLKKSVSSVIKSKHTDSSNSPKENIKVPKESSHSKNKEKLLVNVPKPPTKLDLTADIVSTLPEIQPHYRPLPRLDFSTPKKKEVMTNEMAIQFTTSRREKTNVYSGRKSYFSEVPSLFQCCTQVLIDNIDAIEYMGEVPYFLLKPVLERCTAAQLYNIESYNPHLLDSTNELWEIHCRRDYKLLSPHEHETFRDLYLRAHDERERKLKSVTANISAAMSKSNPVRQVKLAYVDSVAKPPRDVARRQAKNGTALPVNHPVKAGPPSKATPRPTAPAINSAASNNSSSIASTSFAPKKPKVAPLMAKTLKSMKQCFRRK